ncbi:MAG: transcriptional repressor [Planctomycetota bacterium]|nr:transcriptional repressor [Planctomycetota bacterium]
MKRPEQILSMVEVKALIRGAGLRSTAARIAVIQQLASTPNPQSHSEVSEALDDFGFDQSTIYRCLTELSDAGLLARLELGDSVRRFELLQSGASTGFSEHPHFMCVDCGSISCLEEFTFRLNSKKRGAETPGQIVEVLLKGHCVKCQSEVPVDQK